MEIFKPVKSANPGESLSQSGEPHVVLDRAAGGA
jgi:hypothetical protein